MLDGVAAYLQKMNGPLDKFAESVKAMNTALNVFLKAEEERKALPPALKDVAVHPAFIPPGVDIFTEDGIYEWYRLVDSKDYLGQLELQSVAHKVLGGPPDWWVDEDQAMLGWELGLGSPNTEEMTSVWWAMEHGVAPGQAFLLHLPPPKVYKSYEGEIDVGYDVEYDPRVVRVLPIKSPRRAWDGFFRRFETQARALEKRWANIRETQFRVRSKWRLERTDPTPVVRMYVRSSLYLKELVQEAVPPIAQGEGATQEEAFENLRKDFAEKYPGVEDIDLWRLAVDLDIRRPVWDRLEELSCDG